MTIVRTFCECRFAVWSTGKTWKPEFRKLFDREADPAQSSKHTNSATEFNVSIADNLLKCLAASLAVSPQLRLLDSAVLDEDFVGPKGLTHLFHLGLTFGDVDCMDRSEAFFRQEGLGAKGKIIGISGSVESESVLTSRRTPETAVAALTVDGNVFTEISLISKGTELVTAGVNAIAAVLA